MDELKKQDLIRTLIIVGAVILVVLVVLRFLRSMLKSRGVGKVAVASAGETVDVWVDEGEHPVSDSLSDITLAGKSKSVEKIEDFVEKNPAAAAQLLRNWLLDEDM